MNEIESILKEAKYIAKKYKMLTGKPLGITGEVAEFAAAQLLGFELAEVRQSGYDATKKEDGKTVKIQIKGRSVPPKVNPSARIGSVNLNKEWDVVVLVLLDEDLEPMEIYEADRDSITKALLKPGSKARNERGQLGISKFKSISTKIWPIP